MAGTVRQRASDWLGTAGMQFKHHLGDTYRRLASTALMAVVVAAGMIGVPARAEELSKEELAKLAQNPIGNLISVPFQNNMNFNVGPLRGFQDILNIQP